MAECGLCRAGPAGSQVGGFKFPFGIARQAIGTQAAPAPFVTMGEAREPWAAVNNAQLPASVCRVT